MGAVSLGPYNGHTVVVNVRRLVELVFQLGVRDVRPVRAVLVYICLSQ